MILCSQFPIPIIWISEIYKSTQKIKYKIYNVLDTLNTSEKVSLLGEICRDVKAIHRSLSYLKVTLFNLRNQGIDCISTV